MYNYTTYDTSHTTNKALLKLECLKLEENYSADSDNQIEIAREFYAFCIENDNPTSKNPHE